MKTIYENARILFDTMKRNESCKANLYTYFDDITWFVYSFLFKLILIPIILPTNDNNSLNIIFYFVTWYFFFKAFELV